MVFSRVLWRADGLSQRELSARVGRIEPITVIALRSMERSQRIGTGQKRSAASQREACRFGAAAQCQWKHRLGRLIVAAP